MTDSVSKHARHILWTSLFGVTVGRMPIIATWPLRSVVNSMTQFGVKSSSTKDCLRNFSSKILASNKHKNCLCLYNNIRRGGRSNLWATTNVALLLVVIQKREKEIWRIFKSLCQTKAIWKMAERKILSLDKTRRR